MAGLKSKTPESKKKEFLNQEKLYYKNEQEF